MCVHEASVNLGVNVCVIILRILGHSLQAETRLNLNAYAIWMIIK